MWTPTTRRQYSRDHLRYGSDLSDAEWAIIAPFMPTPEQTGRPREWPMREIMNAIFYVLRAGCAWRLLPKDFPPMTTVYGWFLRFRRDGLFETINHHLVMRDRERAGRGASPSAAVIDSQSVKTVEAGGPRGFDALSQRCCASPAEQWAKKDKRAQASRHGQYRRASAHHPGSPRRHSGPRWRNPAASEVATLLPLCRARVRRQRLWCAKGHRCHLHHRRGRQKDCQPSRLSSLATTLGCRTVLRMDQP